MNYEIFEPTEAELELASKMIAKGAKKKNKNYRTLDDEREFMEKLLVQRLNFLILVFPLFLFTGYYVDNCLGQGIMYLAGSFFCWMLSRIIFRAHIKHHWIMRLFYKLPDNGVYYEKNDDDQNPHPIKFINDAMNYKKRICIKQGSVSKFVGLWIPMFTWIVLLLLGLFHILICFLPQFHSFLKEICQSC